MNGIWYVGFFMAVAFSVGEERGTMMECKLEWTPYCIYRVAFCNHEHISLIPRLIPNFLSLTMQYISDKKPLEGIQ